MPAFLGDVPPTTGEVLFGTTVGRLVVGCVALAVAGAAVIAAAVARRRRG